MAIPKSATWASPSREQDVLRFDVAVDDALAVGVGERAGDVGAGCARPRRRAARPRARAGRGATRRDERHGVVEVAGGLAGGEQRDDVRVVQRGGDLDLEAEAVGADAAGQLG